MDSVTILLMLILIGGLIFALPLIIRGWLISRKSPRL